MIKKTGHISLAFILIIATVGWTLNLHYCHEKIYDIGIFAQAEKCCQVHSGNTDDNHNHCGSTLENNNHCSDESVTMTAVDDYVASSFLVKLQPHAITGLFLPASPVTPSYDIAQHIHKYIPQDDIPPPGKQQILSLLQTYLL